MRIPNNIWLSKGIFRKYRGILKSYLASETPTDDVEDMGAYIVEQIIADSGTDTNITGSDGLTYDYRIIETDDGLVHSVCDTNTHVTGVTLNKETTKLVKNATETLVATVAPEGATNDVVIWTTSNAAVATVSTAGLVTCKADTGTATITATTQDGAFAATCVVTAYIAVTGVTLNKPTTSIAKDATETLVATVAPTGATYKTVTWSTSDAAVATVTSGGVVTAKSKHRHSNNNSNYN